MDSPVHSSPSLESNNSLNTECIFQPYTKQSHLKLHQREQFLKDKELRRAKHAQDAHLVGGELKFGSPEDDDELPPENPELKEGFVFTKSYGTIPNDLLGKPIEELDPGIREKTFVIISKRFGKKYIYRYSATSSLFIFTPWNPIRKQCVFLATSQYFDIFIFLTILVNCVIMAMPHLPIGDIFELVFLAIYTFEVMVKVIARGFIFNKRTYLRDPWHILDFTVVVIAFFAILPSYFLVVKTVGNAKGLRTFRVLRALKTVSIVPGLKTIVNALLRAFRGMLEVMVLAIFCLLVFGVYGVLLFKGKMRNKCVQLIPVNVTNSTDFVDDFYIHWINNPEHWYGEGTYQICRNITVESLCPDNYVCLPNIGENPEWGYLSFDNIGWALLTCFQLVTLDFWEDIYNNVLYCAGPMYLFYFIITVFFGSFYLINLMLAIVSVSYEEEAVSAVKEKEREKKEFARRKHHAKYDVSTIQMRLKLANEKSGSALLNVSKSRANEYASNVDGYRSDYAISEANKLGGNLNASALENDDTSNVLSKTVLSSREYDPSKFKKVAVHAAVKQNETSLKKSTNVTIVKADDLLNPEVGFLENQVIDRNCDCLRRLICKYKGFLRFQNYVYVFVADPLFDLFITVVIVVNTVFMSLEHFNQPKLLSTILIWTNRTCTWIFTLEAIVKILGLGKYYFQVGWNIFDLVTSLASQADLMMETVNGLSVLRSFRLLRVFKLAQSWPTMRLLLTIILSTLGALGNLCLILVIVIYIFAIIGMQLFQDDYMRMNANANGNKQRWNFTNFYHSMLMIFRILCGEWIEALYQCMLISNESCMIIFLPSLVLGNFIVLNLFLALLLNAFARDSLDKHRETSADRSKLMDGCHRLRTLICCCIPCLRPRAASREQAESDGEVEYAQEVNFSNTLVNTNPEDDVNLVVKDSQCTPSEAQNCVAANSSTASVSNKNTVRLNLGDSSNSRSLVNTNTNHHLSQSNNTSSFTNTNNCSLDNSNNNSNKPSISKPSGQMLVDTNSLRSSTELNDSYRSSKSMATSFSETPPDCLPVQLSQWLPCFIIDERTSLGRCWTTIRIFTNRLVHNKYFEGVITFIILLSSIELTFEDIYLYEMPTLEYMVKLCNIGFLVLFTVEMLLRWIGIGFKKYFTNFWTLLDFFIVVVSIISLIGETMSGYGIHMAHGIKSLRTLRALRPLRAISRLQGMKIVVSALMNAIPAIMNVLLVCMVFWLIFSIMGVQFFKGKFFRCVDGNNTKFDYNVVTNKTECASAGGLWMNPRINFDNAAIGFLALFQVATFEGWMEVISSATDATEVDRSPSFEANPYAYIYFVVFIVFGSFFSLNLFIGVIIDNFNVLKKKYEGSYLDAFLTESQRNYYNTLKRLGKKKPHKSVKRPRNKVLLIFYNLALSAKFEMGILLLIFLDVILMSMSSYNEIPIIFQCKTIVKTAMTVMFTLEALMKILGLQFNYFRSAWNVIDFIIVILSISGSTHLNISPSLLRIWRVFRMGSFVRLMKDAKGMRKLFFALILSLPAIANIGALLVLFMFVYSILGMFSFSHVKLTPPLNGIVNFQTFGNSFFLVLRLATAGGWNDILEALTIQEPFCNPRNFTMPDGTIRATLHGSCGNSYFAIPFMVSYIIIVWLIVINMYIAVILENFSQAHEQEEVGITEDDFDMFYTVWEIYDPNATQFIRFDQLADLVNDLEPPLQISKPNDITLVTFNIPIMEGDKVHCLDILVALVKNILCEVQESDELTTLKQQMEAKLANSFPSRVNIVVTSSTMQRKKEDVAARTLQRCWRSFKAQRAMRNITALAIQQKVRRMSNICMRSNSTVMNNLSDRITSALKVYFSSSQAFQIYFQETQSQTSINQCLPNSSPIIPLKTTSSVEID